MGRVTKFTESAGSADHESASLWHPISSIEFKLGVPAVESVFPSMIKRDEVHTPPHTQGVSPVVL
jgi:hypothetical protein